LAGYSDIDADGVAVFNGQRFLLGGFRKMKKLCISTDAGILIAILILANLRASIFFPLFPTTAFFPLGLAWIEIGLWGVVFLATARVLIRLNLVSDYWRVWRQTWLLGIFVLLALISLVWSGSFFVTLFRWLEFFFATTIAVYIGVRYDLRRILELLAWGGAYLALFCLLFALFLPPIGVAFGYPYYGAWRGVFWHRNHLGSLMALFNLFFLFQIAMNLRVDKAQTFLWGFFYLLTLSLVVLSRSATGAILLVFLNSAFILLLIWLQVKSRLRLIHYYVLCLGFLVALVIGFLNPDFFFSLFGREFTLAARIDLWNYLLKYVVIKRPILGYGFGFIWNDRMFRIETAEIVRWDFPVMIGDNGFFDILLHLGAIGLFVFLAVLGLACMRAIRFAFAEQTLIGFFPILFMAYALVANISFSLFMETEEFVWMLVVLMLLTTLRPKEILPTC